MELFNSKELEHLRWAINVILFGRCSAYRTRGRSICYNPLNYKARIKQDGTPKEPSELTGRCFRAWWVQHINKQSGTA